MAGIPKESIIPPGGFHFVERHADRPEVRIEGSSYRDVAAKMLQYRLANKLPPGDPLTEIYAYVCGSWPHFCDEHGPMPAPRADTAGHISAQILQWMNQLWRRQAGTPRMLADDTKARARAEKCAGCPKQIPWTDGGCGSCISSAQQVGYIYRAGRTTGLEKTLLACSVARQDNATAVWSENLPDLTPEQRAALPDFCWRKRE